jgi:hypothetical protein
MLSLRGSRIILNLEDDIDSFISSDSISAGIGLKKVFKGLLSASTECWNSSCCIENRWCLNCCHFVKDKGVGIKYIVEYWHTSEIARN